MIDYNKTSGDIKIFEQESQHPVVVLMDYCGTLSPTSDTKTLKIVCRGDNTISNNIELTSDDKLDRILISGSGKLYCNELSSTVIEISGNVQPTRLFANLITLKEGHLQIESGEPVGIVLKGHIWIIDSTLNISNCDIGIFSPYVLVDNSNCLIDVNETAILTDNEVVVQNCQEQIDQVEGNLFETHCLVRGNVKDDYIKNVTTGHEAVFDEAKGNFDSLSITSNQYIVEHPNLTGFFDNPIPTSGTSNEYWSAIQPLNFTTLEDGWAHFSCDNSSGSSSASRSFSINTAGLNFDTSKQYTILVELRNVFTNAVEDKTRVAWRIEVGSASAWDGSANVYQEFTGDGTYWLTNSVKSASRLNQTFYVFTGATLECDIRVSLYEGVYRGPYVPRDGVSLVSRGEAVTPMFQHCLVDNNSANKPNAYWRLVTGANTTTTNAEGSKSCYEQNKDLVAWPSDVSSADGWVHITQDAREATSATNYLNLWVGWDCLNVEEGQTYTWLIEVKHLTLEGDGRLAIEPSIGNPTMDKLSACDRDQCSFETDGTVRAIVTAKPDFTVLDGSRDTRGYASVPSGTKADYWLRLSLYEGEYTGDYQPYRTIATPIRTNENVLAPNDILTVNYNGEAKLIVSNPNLSPFFAHDFSDTYNATTNPNAYWNALSREYITQLSNGWAHFSCDNTEANAIYLNFWPSVSFGVPSEKTTLLIEVKNVTSRGTVTIFGGGDSATALKPMATINIPVNAEGNYYIPMYLDTTVESPMKLVRTFVQVNANSSVECDIRASLYKASQPSNEISHSDLEIGSVARGENSGSTRRFRTIGKIPVLANEYYLFNYVAYGEDLRIGVHQLQEDGTFISDSGWKEMPFALKMSQNTSDVRLVWRRNDDSVIEDLFDAGDFSVYIDKVYAGSYRPYAGSDTCIINLPNVNLSQFENNDTLYIGYNNDSEVFSNELVQKVPVQYEMPKSFVYYLLRDEETDELTKIVSRRKVYGYTPAYTPLTPYDKFKESTQYTNVDLHRRINQYGEIHEGLGTNYIPESVILQIVEDRYGPLDDDFELSRIPYEVIEEIVNDIYVYDGHPHAYESISDDIIDIIVNDGEFPHWWFEIGTLTNAGIDSVSSTRIRTAPGIPVSPSTEYKIVFESEYYTQVSWFQYASENGSTVKTSQGWKESGCEFTTEGNCSWLKLSFARIGDEISPNNYTAFINDEYHVTMYKKDGDIWKIYLPSNTRLKTSGSLTPYFARFSSSGDAYWYSNLSSGTFTGLEDGWAHLSKTNTTSSNTWSRFNIRPQKFVKDVPYYFLIEIRNYSYSTPTPDVYPYIYIAQNNNGQLRRQDSIPALGTDVLRIPGDGAYTLLTCGGNISRNLIYMAESYFGVHPGATIETDIRISMYEADYEELPTGELQSGYLTRTGDIENSSVSKTTDFIDVKDYKTIQILTDIDEIDQKQWNCYLLYDEDKNIIGTYKNGERAAGLTNCYVNVEIPEGVKYIRTSFRKYSNGKIRVLGVSEFDKTYQPYTEEIISFPKTNGYQFDELDSRKYEVGIYSLNSYRTTKLTFHDDSLIEYEEVP